MVALVIKPHWNTIKHRKWSLDIHGSSLCDMVSRYTYCDKRRNVTPRGIEAHDNTSLAFEVALARLHKISVGVCREHRVRVHDIDRRVAKRAKRRSPQPFVDAGLVKLRKARETRIGSMYKNSQGNNGESKRISYISKMEI